MSRAIICALVSTLFVSQVTYIFGKLTTMRLWENDRKYKVSCLSEDDGSALVWNSDLIYDYHKTDIINPILTKFRSSCNPNNQIDCTMNGDTCLYYWNKEHWELTNSASTPMGFVFDERWEAFQENLYASNKMHPLQMKNIDRVVLPFSVRAEHDVHILICANDNFLNSLCYWVIIGGWFNNRSVIRKCTKGVPSIGHNPDNQPECQRERAYLNHTSLDLYEWRSFIIKWDSQTRNLSLYDTEKLIITYTDEQNYTNTNFKNKMFLRTHNSRYYLIRYHHYDYLYTNKEKAILKSNRFSLNSGIACLQMIIGLCSECNANILLRHFTTKKVLQSVTVTGSSVTTVHNLPMWQSVKIMLNDSTDISTSLQIEIIPELQSFHSEPLWAIANIRQCPNKGCFRKSIASISKVWNSRNGSYWHNVTCQKLFYTEHSVVCPLNNPNSSVELDDKKCSSGYIESKCMFNCNSILETKYDCKGVVICNSNGCTCSPGYEGLNCDKGCNDKLYGHACKSTCGFCLNDRPCNKVTGECNNGCKKKENYTYLPPLCQIGIEAPNNIRVNFTNQTAITVSVPMKWKEEYEGINLSYSFQIHELNGIPNNKRKKIFSNTTELVASFTNLLPGTSYRILCAFYVGESPIFSDWKRVFTDCNSITRFILTPYETSLIIDGEHNGNHLYSCPMKSYSLKIKNNDDQYDETAHDSISSFPYTLLSLKIGTSYNVTIFNKDKNNNNKLIYQEDIRTLEGVPSRVLDVEITPLSSSEVKLTWQQPTHPRGKIIEYIVYLRIAKYLGCDNTKQHSLSNYSIVRKTNNTQIKLLELHANVNYDVQVVARNSLHSSEPAKKSFTTPESDIPAVTFSQLKFQNWLLSWNPPENCTAILGPIPVASIDIKGISEAVKNLVFKSINTKQSNIDLKEDLFGAEQYVAKIFALRWYHTQRNISAYEELTFKTPPKAPPNITNLEVVELDKSNKTIQLRWQSPLPPLNGKLQKYVIDLCQDASLCEKFEVQLNETCDLWDNYICKRLNYGHDMPHIKVAAYNLEVKEPGKNVKVTNKMLDNTTPDAPKNFTYSFGKNNVVDLKWLHPWRTGGRLHYFRITFLKMSSNLRRPARRSIDSSTSYNFTVHNYIRIYRQQFYLSPSTQYYVSIQSVTTEMKESVPRNLNFSTPTTTNFNGTVTFETNESDSTISVYVPYIVNETINSMLHIIVNGPDSSPCKNYSQPPKELLKQVGIKEYGTWQAVAFPTSNVSSNGMVFKLGSNMSYGNVINCALKSNELYDIVVIIEESLKPVTIVRKESLSIGIKPSHPENWIIPILIIIAVTVGVIYFYRRKREKSSNNLELQDEIILSQNIETYEHDIKSILGSKQTPSTPSDRQSLSRATTPEVSMIAIKNNYEEKELTLLVKVKDFEDYVKQALKSGLLDKQYETFPRGQTQPWDYGKLPQNKTKNRYGNLIAYDETRVILKKLPDDDYSDYINANYITGYKKKNRYIATQGPKPNTVMDFWRMIWQEKVLIICMLANVVENGKTKCEQYWPDIGKKKKYGDIIVLNATHNVFADYCFRTFYITYGKKTRKVEHLHYTAWPDHGIPLYTNSVVTYLKKLLATPPGDGPVVVHCSAGVGRTGTIILCDICLHRAAAEGVVDVFTENTYIRRERANLVDNKQQYLLAHLVLVECLLSISTTLPCNETLPTRIKELKKQLPIQQQRLQNTAWQDEALRPTTSSVTLSEQNRKKNRFPELISDKVSRVYLKRYPTSDKDSDYISAVYVDGARRQNQYLATQLPLPSTVNDFWRMIAELKVEFIAMLQPPDSEDQTCCAIAPASGEFKPTPYLNITAKEIVEWEYYTSQKLWLVDNSEKPAREQSVTILCCTQWKPGRNQSPPSTMTMVTYWQATEKVARDEGPTVILCQ